MGVNIDQTKTRFGYNPSDLHPASAKLVVYTCDGCGKAAERQRRRTINETLCHKCAIRKPRSAAAQQKFHASMITKFGVPHALQDPELCRRAHENVTPRTPRVYALDALPIDDAETRRRFGYSAAALPPSASEHVVYRCGDCGRLDERVRRNVMLDAACQSCVSSRTWAQRGQDILAKRAETILAAYPHGLPASTKTYGQAEDALAALIEGWGLEVLRRVPIDGRKSLDIVVSSKSVAVEFCGLHWHNEASPTPRDKTYHWNKMRAAAERGLRLITIFEDEWRERRPQVTGVLRSILGAPHARVQARKCEVTELDAKTARVFIEDHHIQRLNTSQLRAWGLTETCTGTLVGVVTLRHHRMSKDRSKVDLTRLCFQTDYQVVGGASRLIRHAAAWAKSAGYASIVTWSDNRWFTGAVYERLGFNLVRDGGPDYAYVKVDCSRGRIPKEQFRKSRTGCPPDVLEHVRALEEGYARIWDCGHKRWELQL